jgi:hypothetical protein
LEILFFKGRINFLVSVYKDNPDLMVISKRHFATYCKFTQLFFNEAPRLQGHRFDWWTVTDILVLNWRRGHKASSKHWYQNTHLNGVTSKQAVIPMSCLLNTTNRLSRWENYDFFLRFNWWRIE